MKYFEWESKYDVGVEKFNNQHKHLLDVLKNVYKAMENKEDKAALAEIISELIKYTKEHFADEEALLLSSGYPDIEAHKSRHQYFIDKTRDFVRDFRSDKQMLHFEIAVFLKNWILQHILDEDKKYGKFLNAKGIF